MCTNVFMMLACQGHPIFCCFPPLVASGPHEEAAYLEEELADDASEVPSAYSPPDDIEETVEEEDEARQSKRARYSKGESGSASSPTKQSNPEMDDTGSSSPSAKEQATLDNPLVVEPLDSALPTEFARMPSVSLASSEEELR